MLYAADFVSALPFGLLPAIVAFAVRFVMRRPMAKAFAWTFSTAGVVGAWIGCTLQFPYISITGAALAVLFGGACSFALLRRGPRSAPLD